MKNSGKLPHYLAVKNELEKRILEGQYVPGEKFPSEEELSREFAVSTSTIKRAIGVLVSNGLLERTPGRGTFVSTCQVQNPLRSFTEEMRNRGLVPGSQLIKQALVKAQGELAWHLDVAEGSEVFFICRLRTANGLPVALDEVFIPASLCPGLFEHNLAAVDAEALLERRYKVNLIQAQEYVTARIATNEEKKLLGGEPDPVVVIVVERKVNGVGNECVMYNRTLYRADRYILHFELKRY